MFPIKTMSHQYIYNCLSVLPFWFYISLFFNSQFRVPNAELLWLILYPDHLLNAPFAGRRFLIPLAVQSSSFAALICFILVSHRPKLYFSLVLSSFSTIAPNTSNKSSREILLWLIYFDWLS